MQFKVMARKTQRKPRNLRHKGGQRSGVGYRLNGEGHSPG